MKTIKLLFITATLALAFILPAAAQVVPVKVQNALSNIVTLDPGAMSGSTGFTNVINAKAISLTPGRSFSICGRYVGTSLCTTGVVGLFFMTSVDGTNYCSATNQMIQAFIVPKGATEAFSYTNIAASVCDNFTYLKLYMITNNNQATNMTGYVTNVLIGQY